MSKAIIDYDKSLIGNKKEKEAIEILTEAL